MANLSPKQFGSPTRSVPMPTQPPGGGFKRVGPTPVPMPTQPPGGGFSPSGIHPAPMPTKVFGR